MPESTASTDAAPKSDIEIAQAATALLHRELDPGRLFRLVGVGVSGFDREPQEANQEVQQPRLAGFE